MTRYRIKEYENRFTVQKYVKPKFVDKLLKYVFFIGYKRWKNVNRYHQPIDVIIEARYRNFTEAEEYIKEMIYFDKSLAKLAKVKPKYHYYPEETK